jgi:hypothetical protein
MRAETEPEMAWRFYADTDERWKWQRLSALGKVIDQSAIGFWSYEECVADAENNGYVFELCATGDRCETLARKT